MTLRNRSQAGFTTVQTLVVIVVAALFFAVAIPAFGAFRRRSATSEAVTNVRRLWDSALAYHSVERQGEVPHCLSCTTPRCCTSGEPSSVLSGGPYSGLHEFEVTTGSPAIFAALGFRPGDVRFQYFVWVSNNDQGAGAGLAVGAVGDQDGDQTFSCFARASDGPALTVLDCGPARLPVGLAPVGETPRPRPLLIVNELE